MVLGVKSIAPIGSLQCGPCRALKNPCGQKTRTALKWRALRFCTGSLFKWTSPTQKQAYNLAFTKSSIAGEFKMLWAHLLACVTGTVNQELLLRKEYLAAEDRILRSQ